MRSLVLTLLCVALALAWTPVDPGTDIMTVVSSTAQIVKPWRTVPFLRDIEWAVWEVEVSEDIYVLVDSTPTYVKLTDFTLDTLMTDATLYTTYRDAFTTTGPMYDGPLFTGSVGWALSGSAALKCPTTDWGTGADWVPAGSPVDSIDAYNPALGNFFALPAVGNPLGIVYGWQFDADMTFPANKLVFVLPLNRIIQTDQTIDGAPVYVTEQLYDIADITQCSIDFATFITNIDGTLWIDQLTDFTAPEPQVCDLASLQTSIAALRDSRKFGANVGEWCATFGFDYDYCIAVAAATWTVDPAWQACEAELQEMTAWDIDLVDVDTASCLLSPAPVDLACMGTADQRTYDCETADLTAYLDDSCCADFAMVDHSGCCAPATISQTVDVFSNETDTTNCTASLQSGLAVDYFVSSFDDSISLCGTYLAQPWEELALLDDLMAVCELEVFFGTCNVSADCWTDVCQGGWCLVPGAPYTYVDPQVAMLKCMAGYALELDPETYPLFASFVTDIFGSADVLLAAVSMDTCIGSDGLVTVDSADCAGYVCPTADDYNLVDPAACWLDWTAGDDVGCLTTDYCNYDDALTTLTTCEDITWTGAFCMDPFLNPEMQPTACWLPSITVDTVCATDYTWDDVYGGCYLETATTLQLCAEELATTMDVATYGADSFIAWLATQHLCITADTVDTCTDTWNPILEICYYDGASGCSTDTEYFPHVWEGLWDSAETCGLTCESDGVYEYDIDSVNTASVCESDGYCTFTDMTLPCTEICETKDDSWCHKMYVTSTFVAADCTFLGGTDQSTYCEIPAWTEAECTDAAWGGIWNDCAGFTVTDCADYDYCSTYTSCVTQAQCDASWVCFGLLMDNSVPFPMLYDACYYPCTGSEDPSAVTVFDDGATVPTSYCLVYEAVLTAATLSCADVLGTAITVPADVAECMAISTTLLDLPDLCIFGVDSDPFFYPVDLVTACDDAACGGQIVPWFVPYDAEWVPNVVVNNFDYWWSEPLMAYENVWGPVVNASIYWYDHMTLLQAAYEQYVLADALDSYSTCLFESEAFTLNLIACDCMGNASACYEQTVTDVATLNVAAPGIYIYEPIFPGGSRLTLNISASFVGITITIRALSVLTLVPTRATTVEVPLTMPVYGDVGDLYGDGFEFVFSEVPTEPLGVCMTKAEFLELQRDLYPAADLATYDIATTAFDILNDDATEDETNLILCGTVSVDGLYFPILRIDPYPPLPSEAPSSGDNGANLALLALLVLILIPVAIVGAVFAFRSKFCRKKLRRVAPK